MCAFSLSLFVLNKKYSLRVRVKGIITTRNRWQATALGGELPPSLESSKSSLSKKNKISARLNKNHQFFQNEHKIILCLHFSLFLSLSPCFSSMINLFYQSYIRILNILNFFVYFDSIVFFFFPLLSLYIHVYYRLNILVVIPVITFIPLLTFSLQT